MIGREKDDDESLFIASILESFRQSNNSEKQLQVLWLKFKILN